MSRGTDAQICIVPAGASDFDAIVALLRQAGLPARDLSAASLRDFLVARDAGGLAGAVGLETHGDTGLLRSLIVDRRCRGRGVGRALVEAVEQRALTRPVRLKMLVLLTETAADFFARRGYLRQPRTQAPAAVQSSSEFAELCPASAVYMEKILGRDTVPAAAR